MNMSLDEKMTIREFLSDGDVENEQVERKISSSTLPKQPKTIDSEEVHEKFIYFNRN